MSSVTFRTGTWTPGGALVVDDASPTSVAPLIDTCPRGEGVAAHLCCHGGRSISETVLFPVLPSQTQGIEDTRFVRFYEDDGSVIYHGTYTAFGGGRVRSELLTTSDFRSFEMRVLTGRASGGKGMALFPRRIAGKYAMLGRQDSKNIWLHFSDELLNWEGGEKLIMPKFHRNSCRWEIAGRRSSSTKAGW